MKSMKLLRPALVCFAVMTLLCGVLYTAVITGAAQLLFPNQANGSIITVTLKDGTKKEYGSERSRRNLPGRNTWSADLPV